MMREVMQNSGLELFAEIGLIIFFVAFVAIIIRAFTMRQDEEAHAANLPLDEGQPTTASQEA
ncbi:MAG: CcoQ/FixQ family Cbb3-type cytochrome c oxidase assembly chaperone [Myxococcales bacterium]|nr:CcoQ/FixQ family Cbb3-type cytochrome c oxidase assembly chaperone [Myxococcales bacterium]